MPPRANIRVVVPDKTPLSEWANSYKGMLGFITSWHFTECFLERL